MTRDGSRLYLSGKLRICPALGQIVNAAGVSVRLKPVNMKVLEALLARSGDVVSRAELYEAVWKNQVVGEDALSRCISDIRAELKTLSDRKDWIETVPKRGYRWSAEASESTVAEVSLTGALTSNGPRDTAESGARLLALRQMAARFPGRIVAFLGALVVVAILAEWSIDQFLSPRVEIVAVLPVSAGQEQTDLAAEFEVGLIRYFMNLEQTRVLSPSAIESRPSNPFPFFYRQFGAQWLVESDVREVSGQNILTISVADARTGIVELQLTHQIEDGDSGIDQLPESILASLSQFIGRQQE